MLYCKRDSVINIRTDKKKSQNHDTYIKYKISICGMSK